MLPLYLQLLTLGLALTAPTEYLQRQDGKSNYRVKSQNAMVAVIVPESLFSAGVNLGAGLFTNFVVPFADTFLQGKRGGESSTTAEPPFFETAGPKETHKPSESSTAKEPASTSVPEDAGSHTTTESSKAPEPTSSTTEATTVKDTIKTTESNTKDEGELGLTLKRSIS